MPRRPYSFSFSNRIFNLSSVFSSRSKKNELQRAALFLIVSLSSIFFYLLEENSSTSILLFPKSISLSQEQKSAVGRLPPLETLRACFISGPAHSSYNIINSRTSYFHRSFSTVFNFRSFVP